MGPSGVYSQQHPSKRTGPEGRSVETDQEKTLARTKYRAVPTEDGDLINNSLSQIPSVGLSLEGKIFFTHCPVFFLDLFHPYFIP